MFEQMRAQGLNPRVCDTPVPYYENKVPCGVPAEVGDTTTDECMMMPRETVHLWHRHSRCRPWPWEAWL